MINFKRISNDVKSGSQSPIPFTYRHSPPPMHGPGRGCALRLSWFLGDTAFRFDFTFFVEEVDGLHRTQSAHVHCPSSQGNPEFPLGENRHKHHAHRTFYRGSPIPMSLRRDSLSLSLFLSLSLSFFSFPSCFSLFHLSLYLSFAPCLVVEKRRSFCMLPLICTHVRVAPRYTCTTRCTPALFLAQVPILFLYTFLCSSLPSFSSYTLALAASLWALVSIRFCFLKKRNRERNKRRGRERKREKERKRSKIGWG